MSHATVAVTPAFQLLMNTMMPAVALGAAGFAVTAGAVMASRKLRCDYEQAKAEFEERCRQDETAITADQNRQSIMSMACTAFGTNVEAGNENTTITFLHQSLEELSTRAEAAGLTGFKSQLAELSQQISADSVSACVQAYFDISDQFEAALLALARQSGDYSQIFAGIRSEMASPVLSGKRHEKLRVQFEEQLVKLESVGDQSSSVVLQGTENLKKRVRREISDQADKQTKEALDRRHSREIVAEAFALLRAVMQASDEPNERTGASTLLTQLGAAFQTGAPPTTSELEALLSKARSLFAKCEKRMDESAAHAFVAESVKDVLLTMGYEVSEVPAETANGDPGCMVSIDKDSGVVVSVAPDGRMLTEMVAFTAAGQDPDEEAERKVCTVVDEIMAGLRKRDIAMQDKSRKKLRPGHRLRMVKKKQQQEFAAASNTKTRAIE